MQTPTPQARARHNFLTNHWAKCIEKSVCSYKLRVSMEGCTHPCRHSIFSSNMWRIPLHQAPNCGRPWFHCCSLFLALTTITLRNKGYLIFSKSKLIFKLFGIPEYQIQTVMILARKQLDLANSTWNCHWAWSSQCRKFRIPRLQVWFPMQKSEVSNACISSILPSTCAFELASTFLFQTSPSIVLIYVTCMRIFANLVQMAADIPLVHGHSCADGQQTPC